MNHHRDRDPLTEALAALPRHQASPGFTEEVLDRLESGPALSIPSTARLLWAAVSVLVVVALTLGFGYQKQRVAERAYQQQVEELRSRYRDLLQEVATVRVEVESPPDTRLYLGGDEQVDLILDLSQSPSYSDPRQQGRDVRPAALEH